MSSSNGKMTQSNVYFFEKRVTDQLIIEIRFWRKKQGWHFIKTSFPIDSEPKTVEMYLPEEVIKQVITDSVLDGLPMDDVPRNGTGEK